MSAMSGLLRRYDQGRILKAVFYGLVVGVAATLAFDYRELARESALAELAAPGSEPVLPGLTENGEPLPGEVETPRETLRQQLAIALEPGGTLSLTGTISPGSADRFGEEIARIGEYVTRVRLDSPGGSVHDALAIGQTIRDRGYETVVKKGALCASSCPLAFAGGIQRVAETGATLGVHQVFAPGNDERDPASAVASAQTTTARIQRYLEAMNVDPALWTLAMETPPNRLHYLTPDEMRTLRLTGGSAVAEASAQ